MSAGDSFSLGGAAGGQRLIEPTLAGGEALAEALGRAAELEQVAAVVSRSKSAAVSRSSPAKTLVQP